MSISRPYGHMYALRSSKSVPGAHLIGGESRSATQSRSTRTKFGDQQDKQTNTCGPRRAFYKEMGAPETRCVHGCGGPRAGREHSWAPASTSR